MPTGIYLRTPEHGQAISRGLKKSGHQPPHFFGEKSSRWKGGRVDRGGYTYVKKWDHPNHQKVGYFAEHRLVMEKHLGRYLLPNEVVHHKNHDKKDNRIENLELCSSHGQHTKICHPEAYVKAALVNKGKRRSPQTEFKKGQIPWNKKVARSQRK